MHYLASWSRKNLDFDVPWFLEKFLHIEFRVSKSRVRFRASRLETFLEFLCGSSDPHSSAPSAKGGLQENGESDLSSLDHCFFGGLDFTVSARDNRDSCSLREPLGFELVGRVAKDLAAWTYEHKARLFAGPSEVGVLCEKSVSRMNGFDSGFFGCSYDLLYVQIAFRRRARTDLIGLVCARDVFGF